MSTITQTDSIQAVFIWMGSTEEEECLPFDLSPYKDGASHSGIIDKVVQLNSSSSSIPVGIWAPSQPPFLDKLNGGSDTGNLVCGSCYLAQIKAASDPQNPGSITIPGAVLAYGDQPGKGSIFNKDSSRAQFLGDVSGLPSCICKGEFKNLITNAEPSSSYSTSQTLTPDKDGIYIKSDGSVHRIFSGKPFQIPSGSKLLKGKFGTLDTDGDGIPDIHDSEPGVSDRDSGGSAPAGPTDQDTLLESFKLTLPARNWTALEFFWDPVSRKYNNKESNYNDWYIALDSSSNTWKTYLIYNNVPTEADEISASINILNTNSETATISDAVHVESPALPKSFVVTGGNIDNNAEGTYTLVFNSNSDFYYTNNNSSIEYQMKYDYDTKNWKSFSVNPINGSLTFYKDVTDPGVKFLTEIVANEVIEMGSDLQRTYLNPAYASKAQTADETIIFNGNSKMNSDWTADSFVMPDCAKSLTKSYLFIPDTSADTLTPGDFDLERKQVASYYPVPPRNRSEFHKELAPNISLSIFGIPLGFGTWDHTNFSTNHTSYSAGTPTTEDLCPAPYGRNKMRFKLNLGDPNSNSGWLPVVDFTWDHYYKRYIARSIVGAGSNSDFALTASFNSYEPLICPTAHTDSYRTFRGWFLVTEGTPGSYVTWNISWGQNAHKVLEGTWFPSDTRGLSMNFYAPGIGGSLVEGGSVVKESYLTQIYEMSDHATYSAEDDYLDPLCLTEQEVRQLYGIAGGFVMTGGSAHDGIYGPVPGNTVYGLPVYSKDGVKGSGPAFYAKVYSEEEAASYQFLSPGSTHWKFLMPGTYIGDGAVPNADGIGHQTTASATGTTESRPWDYDWSDPNSDFGMVLTPTDGLTPLS